MTELKTAIKQAAEKALGKQKIRKAKRLKIWNEELKQNITKKKQLYKNLKYKTYININRIQSPKSKNVN